MDTKEAFDKYFSFSPEEEKKLTEIAGELLEILKERKLTVKDALYVINKCEHAVFLDGINNGLKEQ